MSTREIVLDGGSPWGFRMHGGVDVQQPLKISRVNPGSKASEKGVREGDIITSINNQPTRDITNADAHVLLKKSGDVLKLGLNEECSGSPKRRQHKNLQQEIHSESTESSSTIETSHTTATSITINRITEANCDDQNDQRHSTKINELPLKKNGDSENCVISQTSTRSSNISSSPSSYTSFATDSQGSGKELNRIKEPRDEVLSSTAVITKTVSADKDRDVIDDSDTMGGNSRSHKKRSRGNHRKKPRNTVSLSTVEAMVEISPISLNTHVHECGNVKEESDQSKVFQPNYRVDSPETVPLEASNINKKQNTGTIVKSRSLDDDELKIIEVTETSGVEDDNNVSECTAVVIEADSDDVEWEETEELPGTQLQCLDSSTISLQQQEFENVQVTLISPESERNLRSFLEGLNLVNSAEEAPCCSHQRKEGYKERKARKRAAIAEHFMPILQFPRFLDVIREENSDTSDKESKSDSSGSKLVIVGGKSSEAIANIEVTCSTSIAQTCSTSAEIVYLEDSSSSETSDVEEHAGEVEFLNGSEQASTSETVKVLPPPSQLTPPPTPDLISTPQNEKECERQQSSDFIKNVTSHLSHENYNPIQTLTKDLREIPTEEDAFNKEFKSFCAELNTCKYLNAITPPTLSRSSSISSEESSKSTARYNPMSSSITDDDLCNNVGDNKLLQPQALKEICLTTLLRLPFGGDVLEELAEVAQSIDKLTGSWEMKPSLWRLRKHYPESTNPAFMLKEPIVEPTNSSFTVPATNMEEFPTNWVGVPTHQDPRVLLCLSPTQKSYIEMTNQATEPDKLLELHHKFINRRSYHEEVRDEPNDLGNDNDDNRLLKIIQGFSREQPCGREAKTKSKDLTEWLQLARAKSASTPHLEVLNKDVSGSEAYQSKAGKEGFSGNGNGSTNRRRLSLPHELCQRHLEYIRDKERELQEEIEKLEIEKRKVILEMEAENNPKAELDERNKTISIASTEFFRQKMYDEYMRKVAAREERKMQKVIKITSTKTEESIESNMCEVKHVSDIEGEFMDRVKERMRKHGVKHEDSEENVDANFETNGAVFVMDGDHLKDAKQLPKHLQEFINITREAADVCEDDHSTDGVWSPGQKPEETKYKETARESQATKKNEEPIAPVWTPRSAGSSPTAERKEFKPVNFESPTLGRKHIQVQSIPESQSLRKESDINSSSSNDRQPDQTSAALDRRIPTSHSAPASGLKELSVPKLPRAQNPTITLLQKAREGQLPRGASYIQTESNYSHRKLDDRSRFGTGDVVYQNKSEYSSRELPRKMTNLGTKIYEIDVETRDGIPMTLRSEVKDGTQSRWYKKMYDTIHKQKPDPGYPYVSGYFSEPEHTAFSADYYDSDGTVSDSKYATLDRRRILPPSNDRQNEYVTSTLRSTRSVPKREILLKHDRDLYKSQPGRIENYMPGRSSISEKEAKEWWDEVMDIFDGWLDDHSALPSYNYLLSRAITRSHLEQQKHVPQARGHMSQALKESGYESDSTLVFRRREDALQQLSPSEQKEAYKHIQKGGDVPLQGLRKLAPERPKANGEIDRFSIAPTRIKPQAEVLCYPLTVPPHPRQIFTDYKRTAPSSYIPKPPPIPPSPPKRHSSRNNNTLRLISTINVRSERSPSSKRHETCFTTTSNVDKHKVKYLKDKITCKLSPATKNKEPRAMKVTKTINISPTLRSSVSSTLSTSHKSSPNKTTNKTTPDRCCLLRSSSANSVQKMCKSCTAISQPKKPAILSKSKPGTFGAEKRRVDPLRLSSSKTNFLAKSPELLSPTEVKKAVISQINSLPSNATYKKSHAVYSSVRNGQSGTREKCLPIQVGFTQRGRELLHPLRVSTSLPSTPLLNRAGRIRTATPSPTTSDRPSQKSQSNVSLDSLKSLKMPVKKLSSLTSLKSSRNGKKGSKESLSSDLKKLKKSRKNQLNGEIVKREKKTKIIKPTKKHIETSQELSRFDNQHEQPDNFYALTQDAIQKQREAIQTNSFFQNLFWKNITSPSCSIINAPHSLIAEKTKLLQRCSSSFSEPTIGALKIYLNHTKPVTDSKFRSLDAAALMRSRSASPKSVKWRAISPNVEKVRSVSLPPKLVFTETSRPVSPILEHRHRFKVHERDGALRKSPSKLIFTETSRPVSPIVRRRLYSDDTLGSQEQVYYRERVGSPCQKIILTETSRPVSPVVQRRTPRRERSTSPSKVLFAETSRSVSPVSERSFVRRERSSSPTKLYFTETSRPVSPVSERRIVRRERSSSSSKLYFTETSRPVSPVSERIVVRKSKHSSSPTKVILTETSKPVSPIITRRHIDYSHDCGVRKSASSSKLIFTQTSRPISPAIERKRLVQDDVRKLRDHLESERERSISSPSKLYFSETSRPVSPVLERHQRGILGSLERFSPASSYLDKTFSRAIKESGPMAKFISTETSRRVSPVTERKYDSQRSLCHYEVERDVSPSPKLYFSETSRPVSPIVEKIYIKQSEEEEESDEEHRPRSPSKLYFTETSRPVSPVIQRKIAPAVIFRSPSSRKISQVRDSRVVHDPRPLFDDDLIKEHRTTELLHSPRRCNKFKELNKFYSTLERMGELERTTSSSELRPRRRKEDEIIDFDRWKEVHTRERAEKELEGLYVKLKDDQKEKGFLFRPKEAAAYRWKRELDRGLRIKEQSVENIKDNFEKLKRGSFKYHGIPDEIIFKRDLYKPLWRGSSVVDLATSMVERRSQSEGRVAAIRKKLLESERLLTHGIGSRIWSSLSSEQIDVLKGQLAEIYTTNGDGDQKKHQTSPVDYSIEVVRGQKPSKPKLSVRRNSDEFVRRRYVSEPSKTGESMSSSLILSENDKKRLSQSLSREVMDRVSQKKRASVSLVVGKEMRGAIAAAEAKIKPVENVSPRTCYSLEISEDEKERKHKDSDFVLVLAKDDSDDHKNNISATMEEWAQPKQALVSTDATNRVPYMSETESGSTDESTKTVVYMDVQKKVEYFEQVLEERPYTPTIYRASETENHNDDGETPTDTQNDVGVVEEPRQSRKLVQSQSYQDFKELFGEQEQNKFTTINVANVELPQTSSSIGNLSCNKMKLGEVRYLKGKFEHLEDFKRFSPRRSRSDSELARKHQILIPGQRIGEVDSLRRKYEYPWIFNRGRTRVRRGGVVSPIYFRAEDRYMPHINIISKIASLYPKKTVFLSDVRQKSAEELAKILGCPLGEVERLRQKFDSPDRNISLLGHMFTSSPNVHELRDIAPYLTGDWAAHKFPKMEDNTRALSSPENATTSSDIALVRKNRPRPKSTSPPRIKVKLSPILKHRHTNGVEHKMGKPNAKARIPQPPPQHRSFSSRIEPVRYKSSWPQTARPSVTFKEAEAPTPPPKGHHGIGFFETESPRKYVENEVTIHYKSPIRQEVKESLSEEELSRRQAEHMKRIYEEERRRKYLQVSDSPDELQDMNNRRHTDNFTPSQKSPISLNRYDDFLAEDGPKIKPRPRSPEPRLVARALYNFVGQSARELTFRKGDIIYIRRQVDKNWYEGEHNAMVGLFPVNYVEVIPYDGVKSTIRRPNEGQARAKFNFIAQTHLELSLAKGELVVITRRVDDNWFEGRIGGRKGIFPVSYVEVLIDPSNAPPPPAPLSTKPVASPAAHSMLVNGSAGGKESMGSHSYVPSIPQQQHFTSSYRAKPVHINTAGNYASLSKSASNFKNPINEALHIDTHSEPIPYRALYKYRPQNDDELELFEGDVVFVLEKCDDGWYVGSSQRSGAFGTFPGNYVERI